MSCIGSYVFFDIETTGLPYVDLGNTKITEMTLIGVARSHFDVDPPCVPRVTNTLTLCLNPLGHIGHAASKITNLTNDMLDIMSPFDGRVCDMMISFIERLPQPACLLSHNGNRFDFPILQSHLRAVNMALPDTLLCGDTLTAFRDLKVMERDPSEWRLLAMEPFAEEIDKIDEEEILSQQSQFITPVKNTCSQPRTPVKNPNRTDVRLQSTPVKKQLFQAKSPSYKLVSVHSHVTGSDITNAHSSQADTSAMLSIVSVIGDPFHDWLIRNCVPFSTIKLLW